MNRLSQLASALALATTTVAQIPAVQPFMVVGSLDACSVSGSEFNAGGSVRVNNWNIEVPKNLIVSFPTVFSPFSELCTAGAGGFETTVVGNIVNGRVIAGQISLSQRLSLDYSGGFISAINADGTIQISGGPLVRLNDPEGLFGPKHTGAEHWVVDTANPSVTSFSGFPMCVPYSGNTEKCSTANRPSGNNFTPPDILAMVPFAVGDFIEYTGLQIGTNEMLVSTVTAISVQITTPNNAQSPNYIRVEDFLVGVPDTAANVEFAEMRAIGFVSKCAGTIVTISAVDVDPCTGKETYREMGTATPRQDVRCRWELRIDTPALAPFTREYRITNNGPVVTTKDGIEAGQYIQPVTEWIWPEVDVPGTIPPPYPFQQITDVAQGTVLDGKQYGQLDPFPAANKPTPSKTCSPGDLDPSATPTADPNAPQVSPVARIAAFASAIRVGVDGVLSGSNNATGAPSDDNYNFNWTQTSPSTPQISLTNANSPSATFNAPKVNSETSFVFGLTITSKLNSTLTSSANVTLKVNPTIADNVTMDSYTWESRQSGTISVSCSSNVKNGDNKGMTLLINGSTRLAMTQNGPGKWQYSNRSTARPNNLKCVSDLKGESALRTGTQTTARRRRSARWSS